MSLDKIETGHNARLFEEILSDETLAAVAEYLYDNTDVVIDRKGYAESVDVPDIDFAENYAYISEEDYNKIVEAITEQAKEVRYYEGYILLNDNATLNQIDNPEFDEYDYSDSVENACTKFQLETGVPVYLLGRSGRRVCVEDSFSSFVGYADLKEVQEKLEQEVIDRHSVKESVETLTKSDDTQYIIVGVDNDGNRKFYNVSATPHWVDDCDDATIFDDQSEAHNIFYEIDKTNFRRVFVPNFDRAALKEDINGIQSDEEEFLVVAEQIATFLRGMNIDMDDVSGKITHYDVNMFTDCSEDRIRINWTSYMKKNVVKSNMKILPAMLTQMMKDDTRFEEVIDIFVSEVRDDVVLHNSDLGAVAVEMVASDEFEPKTKVEEVKEAYVHAKSEDDIREIDTGLTHKIDYIILGDVQGQLSDGIWENSPAMNKYWKHLDTEFKDGKVFIVVNNIGHLEDVYRGTRRDYRFLESPFRHMSDDEIKKWVANKIKQIAKHEAQDNDNAPEYAWRADNNTELEYFDSVVTVADAYRTWSKLLGRPVKNPINDIVIKTTPELEIGDIVNGKVLTEIKPDEKDNYWSYLVFENGDEQKVSKHQNHKVNKSTEETFNESVEDENKFAQYVFPLFTEEDKEKAKYYGLVVDDEDEDNTYVSGSYKDIKSFADNYLGYELVDDYLTIYESKDCKESVYAEEPASKEEIELELKNITHNFTDRQGTAKCSFKEEADIGHDILKRYYDKVKVEEQGEWYHLIYKDLLDLDKSIKEDIGADDEVVIGLYGDEVNGFETVDQLAQSFKDNGIEVISKSGDMEYGWDLELKGNARDIYRLVNGKITGYNCATTQEFVDQYRIDESKFVKEDTIKMTADEMKDKFGTDNPDIINCGRPEEDGTIELKEPETIKENTKTGKELEVGDLFVCPETGKQFKVIDTLGNDGQTLNIKVKEFKTGEESIINIGINSPWETITIVESVSEEEPYTKEMVEADLKSITRNFTNKEGELQCGFEIEKDYGVEILKQHYEIVEPSIDDKYEDVKYHISYAKPKVVKESIDSKVLEGRIEDIEYVMNNYAKGSIFIDDVKGSGVNYRVTYNDVTVDVRFDTYFSEYTYYINEHGPYCHSSYEYIVRDIMDFIDYNHLGQSDEEVDESLIKESKSAVKSILEPQVKDGKVKPFGTEQKCPRGFSFKSNNGTSGTCRYNGTDYVFAVVDGELRVMTDAEAGWNWSETIYKK